MAPPSPISGYAAYFASHWTAPLMKAWLGGTPWMLPVLPLIGLAGMLAGACSASLIYLVAFLPIHDKQNFAVRSLIVTLAINLATVQALLFCFGPQQKSLPRIFGSGRFEFFGAPIRFDQIVTILTTAVLLAPCCCGFATAARASRSAP